MSYFDLHGPEFLALYVVVLVTSIVTARRLRRMLRTPDDEPDERTLGALDPYDIAYLATGNGASLAGVGLAGLCQQGTLAVTRQGREALVTAPGGPPLAGAHPVEQAVYRYVAAMLAPAAPPGAPPLRRFFAGGPRRATAGQVRLLPLLGEAAAIQKRLRDRGLLLSPGQALAEWLLPPLVMLPAAIFGWIKIAVGLSRNRPMGFLLLLVIVSMIAAVLLLCESLSGRTLRGDRALERLRQRHAALQVAARSGAAQLPARDLAFAVGLFGVGVLYGGPLDLLAPARAASGGGGGDGSGGGCGGGGCGGGGCGGGCGGCGGG